MKQCTERANFENVDEFVLSTLIWIFSENSSHKNNSATASTIPRNHPTDVTAECISNLHITCKSIHLLARVQQ
jgi:hypothetical protein